MNTIIRLGARLKTVASAILADVEPGFQPGGRNHTTENGLAPLERHRHAGDLSGWQDATLYGRPGGPPLLFKHALGQCSLFAAMTAVLAISATPLRAAFVLNPSFESNWNTANPHYGSIDSWTGGNGVNDRSLDRGGPFHDNGLTPDGNRVAFKQQTGDLSQGITGLTVGQLYWIQFYYNTRGDVLSGTCDITTRFAGTDLDSVTGIQRVTAPEGTNAIIVPVS